VPRQVITAAVCVHIAVSAEEHAIVSAEHSCGGGTQHTSCAREPRRARHTALGGLQRKGGEGWVSALRCVMQGECTDPRRPCTTSQQQLAQERYRTRTQGAGCLPSCNGCRWRLAGSDTRGVLLGRREFAKVGVCQSSLTTASGSDPASG
jgi:hypothetical protein